MSTSNGTKIEAVEGDVVEDAPGRGAPKAKVGMRGGQFVVEDMDGLWRLACMFAAAGLGPQVGKYPNRRKLTREEMFAVLSFGMAAGLSVPQSLTNVYLINDKPALHSDAIPALLLASGKCIYRDGYENPDSENDKDLVAWAEVERRDIPGVKIRREFSMRDALKAHLLAKDGPWKDYPKRMLLMRARAWAVRDGAADILGGLGVAEEIEDIPTQRVVVRDAAVSEAREAARAVAEEATKALPAPSPVPPIVFEAPKADAAFAEQAAAGMAAVELEREKKKEPPLAKVSGRALNVVVADDNPEAAAKVVEKWRAERRKAGGK